MIVYIVVNIISLILIYLSQKTKNKIQSNVLILVTILLLSIVAGIRYGIGTDYLKVYYPYFLEIKSGSTWDSNRIEIGYYLLNKIVVLINGSFPLVMLITSFITNYFFIKGILNFKDKISVTVAMFVYLFLYYLQTYNLIRQYIACSIIFFSIKFLMEKNIKKFVIFVLIASLFHKTAMIFLIVPFLIKIYAYKDNKVIRYISYFVLLVVILNFQKLGNILLDSDNLKYYSGYLTEKENSGITIGFFIRGLPIIIPYVFLNKTISNQKDIFFMFSLTIIGCIINLLAYLTSTYGQRLAIYFTIFQIIVIAYFSKNISKDKFIIKHLLNIIIIFLWYYDFIYMEMNEVVPYSTIFK